MHVFDCESTLSQPQKMSRAMFANARLPSLAFAASSCAARASAPTPIAAAHATIDADRAFKISAILSARAPAQACIALSNAILAACILLK